MLLHIHTLIFSACFLAYNIRFQILIHNDGTISTHVIQNILHAIYHLRVYYYDSSLLLQSNKRKMYTTYNCTNMCKKLSILKLNILIFSIFNKYGI